MPVLHLSGSTGCLTDEIDNMKKTLIRVNARLLAMVLVLISITGCAAWQKQKPNQGDLAESVDSFATALRWGDYQTAAVFILPEDESTFWEDAEELIHSIRIAKMEIRSVKVNDKKGTAHISCTYYRLDDPRFQTVLLHQKWHYDDNMKAWQVIDSEIYKLLP